MVRVLAAASAAVLVLSACGGGGTSATTAPATASAAPVAADVTVQGFKFGPQALEVKAGMKVTWTNKDTAGHTTTSGKPGAKDGKWEGQLAPSSGTFSFTFAQPGTFDYFCSIHNTMTGSVVVK